MSENIKESEFLDEENNNNEDNKTKDESLSSSFVHREVKKYKTKGKTEPILSLFESNSNETATPSIHDRLAALKKNEEEWKSRTGLENNENAFSPVVSETTTRPKSIISKITELQLDAETSWRKRVPENDAKKFTVASKIDSKLKTNLTENIQSYLTPGSNMTASKLKKLASQNSEQSFENIEDIENQNSSSRREKIVPDYKRVMLNKGAEMINIGVFYSNFSFLVSIFIYFLF